MKARGGDVLPRARAEKLIVRELPDEVLVYDLKRDKAHCLNRTSAAVWKRCDGRTTVEEMARVLEREFDTEVGQDIVWLALNQLRRYHLLEESGGPLAMMKVTRRDLIRKYLPAALIVPVVLSISSPVAAQAVSGCADVGQSCNVLPCCGALFCAGPPGARVCQINAP